MVSPDNIPACSRFFLPISSVLAPSGGHKTSLEKSNSTQRYSACLLEAPISSGGSVRGKGLSRASLVAGHIRLLGILVARQTALGLDCWLQYNLLFSHFLCQKASMGTLVAYLKHTQMPKVNILSQRQGKTEIIL